MNINEMSGHPDGSQVIGGNKGYTAKKMWDKIILNSCYGLPAPADSFKFFDAKVAELILTNMQARWSNSTRRENLKKLLDDDE